MTPPISNTIPLRKHILTAAHCFDKPSRTASNVDVRIGQDNIKEEEWQGTEANIARVKIHERWVNVTSRGLHSILTSDCARYERGNEVRRSPVNDIAIVTLDTRVTSRRVTPVCLPQECYRKYVMITFDNQHTGHGIRSIN